MKFASSPAKKAKAPAFSYFSVQASWGISKPHYGGLKATSELLKMCHLSTDKYVLDVGCGVGLTACYIARNYACRVVGVDLSDEMLSLASQRIRRQGIERIELKKADAQDLPFEDNTFDLVISESVVSFVSNKERALAEYARVTKPGGYIGINEAVWLNEVHSEIDDYIRRLSGAELKKAGEWKILFEEIGLKDVKTKIYRTSVLNQLKDEFVSIGLRDYAKGWGRFLSMLFLDRGFRMYMKDIWPERRLLKNFFKYIGYGLYAGRKPQLSGR